MVNNVNPIIKAFNNITLGDEHLEQYKNSDNKTDNNILLVLIEKLNILSIRTVLENVIKFNDKLPSITKLQRFKGKKSEFYIFKSQVTLYIYFNC